MCEILPPTVSEPRSDNRCRGSLEIRDKRKELSTTRLKMCFKNVDSCKSIKTAVIEAGVDRGSDQREDEGTFCDVDGRANYEVCVCR